MGFEMSMKCGIRLILVLAVIAFSPPFAASALDLPTGSSDLSIGPEDVRINARDDGGYDLYVRAKLGMASILLTETTKDPAMKADNFAYRAMERNDVNGGETRLLNGKPLPASSKLYSLISSTPLPYADFGTAFRILIPPVLIYGYPWSRSGTVAVGQGTYLNIRAFAKRYADYSGAFLDNPYQIAISAKPIPPITEPATVITAPQIQAQVAAPPPPADDRPSAKIVGLIDTSPKSLDLVLCLDTTASMVPYFDDIRKNIGPMLRERVSGFSRFRIGVVLYKDYWPDEYITRNYPYTSDIAVIERIVKSAVVYGGGDIPEAEVEALNAAETEFDWSADGRQVIVLTDAPPHPDPRGKILFDDVASMAEAKGIKLDAVNEPTMMLLLPQSRPPRVRERGQVPRFAFRKRLGPVVRPRRRLSPSRGRRGGRFDGNGLAETAGPFGGQARRRPLLGITRLLPAPRRGEGAGRCRRDGYRGHEAAGRVDRRHSRDYHPDAKLRRLFRDGLAPDRRRDRACAGP